MSEAEFNSYIENVEAPAEELEGEVKEKDGEKEEEKLEVKVDDVPNSSGEKEESGEEVVAKIQKEVLGETGTETKEEEGTDIPDSFTKACLEQGWTEDEIKEFAADLDDTALLELIPELLGKEEKQEKSESGEVQTKQEVKAKATDDTAKKEPTNE